MKQNFGNQLKESQGVFRTSEFFSNQYWNDELFGCFARPKTFADHIEETKKLKRVTIFFLQLRNFPVEKLFYKTYFQPNLQFIVLVYGTANVSAFLIILRIIFWLPKIESVSKFEEELKILNARHLYELIKVLSRTLRQDSAHFVEFCH